MYVLCSSVVTIKCTHTHRQRRSHLAIIMFPSFKYVIIIRLPSAPQHGEAAAADEKNFGGTGYFEIRKYFKILYIKLRAHSKITSLPFSKLRFAEARTSSNLAIGSSSD